MPMNAEFKVNAEGRNKIRSGGKSLIWLKCSSCQTYLKIFGFNPINFSFIFFCPQCRREFELADFRGNNSWQILAENYW